eukprot:3216730-Rhodomonas_salina.2
MEVVTGRIIAHRVGFAPDGAEIARGCRNSFFLACQICWKITQKLCPGSPSAAAAVRARHRVTGSEPGPPDLTQ